MPIFWQLVEASGRRCVSLWEQNVSPVVGVTPNLSTTRPWSQIRHKKTRYFKPITAGGKSLLAANEPLTLTSLPFCDENSHPPKSSSASNGVTPLLCVPRVDSSSSTYTASDTSFPLVKAMSRFFKQVFTVFKRVILSEICSRNRSLGSTGVRGTQMQD